MDSPARIYLDFDDVICETARTLTELLYKMCGRSVAYEEIYAFDLGKSFELSEVELQRLMHLAHEDDFLMSLPPSDGALSGIRSLVDSGLQPVIVTGRPAHCFRSSARWLQREGFPAIPVVYVDKYGRDPGLIDEDAPLPMGIAELLEQPFVMGVDDSPVALDLLRGRVDYPLIVFDRPWNRDYPDGADGDSTVLRSHGWEDLCDLVHRLMCSQVTQI